jgi:polyhydroxyalkanoate synthesis regulator phasin
MKLNTLTQFTAFSLALISATTFAASNDALLDLLVKKGVLTEDEATAVAAELEEEQPVFVKAKGKAVQDIKLTGRLHAQYDNISNDVGESSQNGLYFRRLYLGAEAKFANNWSASIVANFGGEDGDAEIDKAIVGWKYDPMAEFEVGYTKVPFGYYETTSSSKIKTVERSIASRYFAEGDGLSFNARHTGAFVEGDLGGGFAYAAALVSNTAGNDRTDRLRDDNNGLAFYGRLEWESEATDAGQFLVGVDLGHKDEGSTIGGGEGDLFAYGLHANYELGGLKLSGEVLGTTVEDVAGEDQDVFGFTVVPSYQINDKWEVVAAYSFIDTDGADLLNADDLVRRSNVDKGYAYSEGESFYIGFNYYIIGNDLKLSGGYENANFESTTKEEVQIDAFRLRLQALF